MRPTWSHQALLLLALATACDDGRTIEPSTDGGPSDGAPPDGAPPDGAPPDGGSLDGAAPDAGGPPDAAPDAGDAAPDARIEPPVERCGNDRDDDGDGFADCADDACFADPGCGACDEAPGADWDMDVLFVSRTPRRPRYRVEYDAVGPARWTGGEWPAPGSTVTFTAAVANKGAGTSRGYVVEWSVDGAVAARDVTGCLGPGEVARHAFPWTWRELPADLGVRIVPLGVAPDAEARPQNNARAIRSDALAFRFHVEPAVRAKFDALENVVGTRSFEDWAWAHVDAMNEMLAGTGVQVFLDEVVVEDDLPATGEHAPEDLEWDGRWGFDDAEWSDAKIAREVVAVQNTLLHELTHQLGVIDMYALNYDLNYVAANEVNGEAWYLDALCEGPRAACPAIGLMMDLNLRRYSDHVLRALRTGAGHRRGFYGEYLYDVPARNTVRIRLADGGDPAHLELTFFQAHRNTLDDTPEFTVTTDASGEAELPNRPITRAITTPTGHTLRPNPFGDIDVVGLNGLFLVRADTPAGPRHGWLSIYSFNMAFWAWRDAHPDAPPAESTGTYEVVLR